MKYKVLDVINRLSGETADKYGVIGKVMTPVIPLQTGRSAILQQPNGMNLRTSDVAGITEVGDVVEVTTLNTIYVLQLVVAKSADTSGMTYVMSKQAHRQYSKESPMTDVRIMMYVNQMMGLRGTFTKLQVK